jgi:hypothetical protein
LCASENPGIELCEVAVAELTDSVRIDGLDADAQPAAELDATTGRIGSALYDYGVSYLLTEPAPRAAQAAPAGHSAVLEGEVERAGERLAFSAAVDVVPLAAGELAGAQRTSHRVRGEGERLVVEIEPYAWLTRIDVDALFALDDDGDGQVRIEPGTQAYESIVQGMQNRAPAKLIWGTEP